MITDNMNQEQMNDLIRAVLLLETPEEAQADEPDTAKYPDRVVHGLRLLIDGKASEFAAYAVELNMFADTLAEQINESLYDEIGDVVIESDGEVYIIIEDYREDIDGILDEMVK